MSGEWYEDFAAVRDFKIQGTAFSILFTVARDTVWIIDVRERRGLRSAEALRMFAREIKKALRE